MLNGNGTWPFFGIQQPRIAGNLSHFWPDEYRLCLKAELMASTKHKLHKLLVMHSTLPLVTRSVALGLRVKCATPKKLAEDAQTEIAYSQKATRKSTVSENHTVQNTMERASHHLLYEAKNYEASETRELYAARDHKASENPNVYEARSKKASEKKMCMKPIKCKASEKERALGALYKRLEAGRKKKDEARSEEAT